MSEREPSQPISDPENLLHLKGEMMTCWEQLPIEHQATMGLVLLRDVLEGAYGAWMTEAMQTDGEEVSDMLNADESQMVRAGGRTYFLDLKRTAEEKGYLVITESRFKGEGKGHRRQRIIVFEDDAEAFLKAVSEMIGKL